MILKVIRNPTPDQGALTGELYIDDRYFCPTLERKGVEILPIWYRVSVTQSPKFKRLLPLVNGVPGRSGIRFHVGTKPKHSSGCILVPNRETEDRLTNLLLEAQKRHEEIRLEVTYKTPQYTDTPCPLELCAPRNFCLD